MRWIITLVIPLSLAAQAPRSADYEAVQNRLARGWNTWDVHSVTAQVLLPEGFTIRVGLKHNSSLNSDAFLSDALVGSPGPGVELRVSGSPHFGTAPIPNCAWPGATTFSCWRPRTMATTS